jgi:multicomponent Na+:H+ antiporter subunit B
MGVVFLNYLLLALLALIGITVVRLRNLFGVVMLGGIYSFLSAALFMVMDAADVAFTEAAVGAGISTVLALGTLALVGSEERPPTRRPILPLVVVAITGAALIYGTLDMPPFLEPDNPIHQHVAPRYIEQIGEEVDIPNIVSAVLASYRGYDTMGETTVVFTAAAGVMLLLSDLRRRRREGEKEERA